MFEYVYAIGSWYIFIGLVVWCLTGLVFSVALPYVKKCFPEEEFLEADQALIDFSSKPLFYLGYMFVAWPIFLWTVFTRRSAWL